LFRLVEAWLLVPAVAVILATILSRAGHVAVSNLDILDFLLTPTGLFYATLFGTLGMALLLFEQAGVMVLAALAGSDERLPFKRMLRPAFRKLLGIVQLGAVVAALLALALAPFVLLGFLTYRTLLSEHDIYFYLTDRPPAFWLAAGIGGLLLLVALAIVTVLYIRWAFALPILLFENRSFRAALRASRERVRGVGWRIGFLLLGWLVSVLLLGAAVEGVFRLVAAAILANAGERPVVLILLLLVAQGGLLATLSFVLVIGLGLVTRRLYLIRSQKLGLLRAQGWETAPDLDKPASPWNWRLAWLAMPLFLLAPVFLWIELSRYTAARSPVQVTAHRGHARAAPENTRSAILKAIESGADYAEMDVQPTADGVVVLLHDRDLKRVAGESRRLDELSAEEVRKLDVGSWFDPAFAGERVPTLVEIINLARGKIRLNIELKFFGPDRRLVQQVVNIVREQNVASDCLITSLNYDALVEVKQRDPSLRTGLIVAQALGDVSRLEVDVLAVRADFLSDELLRSAHRDGKEVHVWTVNEAPQMFRLIKRGADNIITSDPDLAVLVREEWANLTGTERLVLSSRLLLGLEP
ncbi:MAG TPA: glycerophosphodiester phosphodiesterase family protein, partial [Gemmataceae bacterium]|nr:glycerophosphodiester phosphodiesterase family protein [Gemmataceae bacterium]